MSEFISIKSQRDVVLITLLATACSVFLVAVATLLIYPPEAWAEEILIHGGITALFVFIVTVKFCDLMRRNYELFEQLRARADTDPLTKVATRRLFFERLEADPGLAGVSLMVDIDHFKQVNDTYGHLVGDRVIQSVADILGHHIRSSDIICRFGGEEFAIFLRDSPAELGAEIAERMRRGVEDAKIAVDDRAVSVSVSIGASTKEAREDISTSLSRADYALYRAKEGGRNRVSLNWPGWRRRFSRGTPASRGASGVV